MRGRYSVAVVTNDIYTKEDALILARSQALSRSGSSASRRRLPAYRDPRGRLDHLARSRDAAAVPDSTDLHRIRRDNLAATFSPELADLTLTSSTSPAARRYRGRRARITRSDLLIVNKIDLAPYVGADLDRMEEDTRRIRAERPYVFADTLRARPRPHHAFIEARAAWNRRASRPPDARPATNGNPTRRGASPTTLALRFDRIGAMVRRFLQLRVVTAMPTASTWPACSSPSPYLALPLSGLHHRLASYLAVLEALWLWTKEDRYIQVFRYWLRIFAVAFAMGVVSDS